MGEARGSDPVRRSPWITAAWLLPVVLSAGCRGPEGATGPAGVSEALADVRVSFQLDGGLLRADGASIVDLRASVTSNNQPVAGKPVWFRVLGGDLAITSAGEATNLDGEATVSLRAGTTYGDARVAMSTDVGEQTLTWPTTVWIDPVEVSPPLRPDELAAVRDVAWRPGHAELLVSDNEIGVVRVLLDDGELIPIGFFNEAVWRPDGSELLVRWRQEVRRITPDGEILATSEVLDNLDEITWTPDGTRVVVSTWRSGAAFVLDLDLEIEWAFSLDRVDGFAIAADELLVGGDLVGGPGVFRLDPATGELEPLVLLDGSVGLEAHVVTMTVDPIGGWLLVAGVVPTGHTDLVRFPLTGGAGESLLSTPHSLRHPTLSPDGTRIAFDSYRSGASRVHTFTLPSTSELP